jgi:hypothetical protein
MRNILLTACLMLIPATSLCAQEEGSKWSSDPNGGRLFFAPTARIVPEREAAVTLYEVIMPTFSYTVTKDLILTVGTPFETETDGTRSWLISGKLSLPTHRDFEAALAGMTVLGGTSIWGMVYGVVTIGNDNLSLTGGAGYAYFENSLGFQTLTADGAAVLIGGELRLGPSLKLISENHFLPASDPFISLGIRIIGERLSVDFGMGAFNPITDPGLVPIMVLAYSW